jgi:transmembrane sensor
MSQGMETREQIENAAAAWIFKRDAGEWTATDEAELAQWLQASSAHRIVFLRLDSAWREASRLQAVGAGMERGSVPARQSFPARPLVESTGTPREHEMAQVDAPERQVRSTHTPSARSRRVFGAVAASVLLAVAIAAFWIFAPSRPAYHTDIGGLEGVSMPDGSRVTLNTDSAVRVAVTETERRVDLEQGEAFFDVAKDPAKPFVVVAGAQRVVVLGTKFSVRRDQNEVQVIVSEGRVRMERSGGRGTQIPTADLTAGSIARSDGEALRIEKKAPGEVEKYLSWRGGFLVFDGTPLADAVAEFNRYSTKKIVIEDPRLAGMSIDGNFRSNNVEAFVRLLETGFPIEIERSEDRIVVRSNR